MAILSLGRDREAIRNVAWSYSSLCRNIFPCIFPCPPNASSSPSRSTSSHWDNHRRIPAVKRKASPLSGPGCIFPQRLTPLYGANGIGVTGVVFSVAFGAALGALSSLNALNSSRNLEFTMVFGVLRVLGVFAARRFIFKTTA